ncbi:hypothetical protein [Paenibacillus humicola]|uniref:hypothetical protein n=1 Tax=Paenibacillus humicola TaxID=3110540 RepID=UPI00237C4764|nr:hypothetical protein [Paenibacillus humicola]
MKNRCILPAAAFIIFVMTSCTTNNIVFEPINRILQIEDIASIQVVGGPPRTKPSPLYKFSDGTGKALITKIGGWINSSVPLGTQPDYGRHGYPRILKIQFNAGKPIFVEPGYKCIKLKKSPADIYIPETQTVTIKSCGAIKDEIVLSSVSINLRAKSPELYEWLIEGWKTEHNKPSIPVEVMDYKNR